MDTKYGQTPPGLPRARGTPSPGVGAPAQRTGSASRPQPMAPGFLRTQADAGEDAAATPLGRRDAAIQRAASEATEASPGRDADVHPGPHPELAAPPAPRVQASHAGPTGTPACVLEFEEGFALGAAVPRNRRSDPGAIAAVVRQVLAKAGDLAQADQRLPRLFSGLVHALKRASDEPHLGMQVAACLLELGEPAVAADGSERSPYPLTPAQRQGCLHAIALASRTQFGSGVDARRVDYAAKTASRRVAGEHGQAGRWSEADAETFQALAGQAPRELSISARSSSWTLEGDLAAAWHNGLGGVDLQALWPEDPESRPQPPAHAPVDDEEHADAEPEPEIQPLAPASPAPQPLAHWLDAIADLRPIEQMTPAQLRSKLAALEALVPAERPSSLASLATAASAAPPQALEPRPMRPSPSPSPSLSSSSPSSSAHPSATYPTLPCQESFVVLRTLHQGWISLVDDLYSTVEAISKPEEETVRQEFLEATAGAHVRRLLDGKLHRLADVYQQLTWSLEDAPLASRIDAWVEAFPDKAHAYALEHYRRELLPDAADEAPEPFDPRQNRMPLASQISDLAEAFRKEIARIEAEGLAAEEEDEDEEQEQDAGSFPAAPAGESEKVRRVADLKQTHRTLLGLAQEAADRAKAHRDETLEDHGFDMDSPTLDKKLLLLATDLRAYLRSPRTAEFSPVAAEPVRSAPATPSDVQGPAVAPTTRPQITRL